MSFILRDIKNPIKSIKVNTKNKYLKEGIKSNKETAISGAII